MHTTKISLNGLRRIVKQVMNENYDNLSDDDFEKMANRKITGQKQMDKYNSDLQRLFNAYQAYKSHENFPTINLETVAEFHDSNVVDIEALLQDPGKLNAIEYVLKKNGLI